MQCRVGFAMSRSSDISPDSLGEYRTPKKKRLRTHDVMLNVVLNVKISP